MVQKSVVFRALGTFSIALIALIGLLIALNNVSMQAGPLLLGTGTDPAIVAITVTSNAAISDTHPGDGIAKTVYLADPAVVTLSFDISGTPWLTLTTDPAFGSPSQLLTSTQPSWIVAISYSIASGQGSLPGVYYTAANTDGVQVAVPITYVRDVAAPVATIQDPPAPRWISSTTTMAGVSTDGTGAGVRQVEVLTPPGSTWHAATGVDNWQYIWTPPAAQNGTAYELEVRAVDYLGQTQSPAATRVFTVDNLMADTVHTLASTTHTTGAWSNHSAITVTWTPAGDGPGSGLAGYAALWDHNPATTPPPVLSLSAATTFTTTDLGDGTNYYFHIRAVDQMENWGPAAHLGPFHIDTNPPSVPVLSSPANGTQTRLVAVTMDWSDSTDVSGSGVSGYDVDLSSTIYPATASTLTRVVPGDGAYTWRVRSRDVAGNASSYTASWTFTVDATAPDVPTLEFPADGAITNTTAMTFQWSDEAASGAVSYTLDVGGTLYPSISNAHTVNLTTDGAYAWTVRAWDALGNVSDAAISRSLTRDTIPPLVSISAPADQDVLTMTHLTSIAIEGTASDDRTGITSVEVHIPAGWVTANGTNPWSYTWALPIVDHADYGLSARTRDGATNLGLSSPITVTVDTVAPTAQAPTPQHAPWVTSTIVYVWPPSSDGAGIRGYDIQITNTAEYNQVFHTATPGFTFTQANSEGASYYARVRAIDGTGNVGPWSARSSGVTVDLTAPSISSPSILETSSYLYAVGTQLYYTNTMPLAQLFAVRGNSADTLSGLARVRFSSAFGVTPADDTSGFTPWQSASPDYAIAFGTTASGSITARVYDRAGNSAVQTYAYELDGTAPESTSSSPPYASSSPIGVTWVATDTQSGVSSTTLWYRKETTGTWTSYQTLNAGSGTFNFVPPAGDGTYFFATAARDRLGNQEPAPTISETQTIYDTRVPQSMVDWAPQYRNASPITVTWVATPSLAPISEVRLWYRLDGGAWTSTSLANSGPATSGTFAFAPSGDGVYNFATVAQDTLLKSEANPYGAGDVQTTFDTHGPVLTIQYPSAGDVLTVTASSTVITGTSLDVPAGITQVFVTTGAAWNPATGLDPWSYAWTLPTADAVLYTIGARATDRAGNEGLATEVQVTVDTVAPSAAVPSAHASPWVTQTIIYNWADSSDGAGISGYEVHITNDRGYTALFTSPVSELAFTQAYSEGAAYYATVRAIDGYGNIGSWSSQSAAVIPDLTAPVLSSLGIGESSAYLVVSGTSLFYINTMGTAAMFTVRGDAEDVLSGLDYASFSTAFGQHPPNDTDPRTFTANYYIPPGATASGSITARIYDRAGNSAVQTYTYALDNTAPESTSLSPFFVGSSPIQVTWVATDTQSGVSATTLWYRKEATGTWTAYQTLNAGSGTFNFVPPDGDGLYFFATAAVDRLGNQEPAPTMSETQTIYDTHVPQSMVDWAPQVRNASPITVTWVATPSVTPITEVRLWYRLDEGAWTSTSLASSGPATSGTFAFVPPNNGIYEFATVARADYRVESLPSSGDATTTYDTQIASVSALAANPPTWNNSSIFAVTWNNPADLSGIAGAYYRLDSAPTSPTGGTWVPGDDLEQISGIVVSTDGAHTLWLWLADKAGNVNHALAQSVSLRRDTTIGSPSNLTANPSAWTRTDLFAVTWQNPSDLSGIAGAYYKLDTAPTSSTDGTWTSGSQLNQIQGIHVGTSGSHVLYLWLRDAAGNADHNTRKTVTLRYDATPPTQVAVVAPEQTNDQAFEVSWAASDQPSGVDHYTVEYSSTAHVGWQLWLSTKAVSGTFATTERDLDFTFRVTAYDQAGNSAQAQTSTRVGMRQTYLPVTLKTWAWWYTYDRYEPNNTPPQAYGPLASGQIYQGYIWDSTDRDDYYYLTTATTAKVQVGLSQIPADGDYDLYIYYYDGQYRLVTYSNNTQNNNEYVSFTPVVGRRYYVRVYAYRGSSNQYTYHLQVAYD